MKLIRVVKNIFLFGIALNINTIAFSQSNLPSEEVTINKDYRPLLADAEKINLTAVPSPVDTAMEAINYKVNSHVIDVPFIPSEIKPVAISQSVIETTQNNVVKAGFGMQLTPLLDVYLGNGRNEKFSYGLSLNHLSSNGSKIEYQDESHSGASAFGKSYFKNTELFAKMALDRDVFHFYGFESSFVDTSNLYSKEVLKQQFQNFSGEISLRNTKLTKADINYYFSFKFHALSDPAFAVSQNDVAENYFYGEFGISKYIQKVHSANLDFKFCRDDFSELNIDTAINYFSVLPSYQYYSKTLFIKAGLNVSIVGNEVNLYPDAEVSYKLIDDYLVLFAGAKGTDNANSVLSLSQQNPFVSNYHIGTTKSLNGYLGIRGSYGSNITYNLSGKYAVVDNLSVFLPAGSNPTYFINDFYSQAKILGFNGEVGYKQSERLNLMLSAEANSYNMNGHDEPWGIPKSKLTFTGNYNIQDKIILQADVFLQSGAYTIIPGDTVSTKLKGFADFNLSATYNYKKNISFWTSFNNIASMKQRQWYNYSYYGFRAMAGIIFKF